MRIAPFKYSWLFVFSIAIALGQHVSGQKQNNTTKKSAKLPDSLYIKRYDTLFHLQTWISANQMEYRLKYTKDFKLILSPNEINNLSFGFSYRFLEIGFGFTPQFLNAKDTDLKGKSEKFSFGFGFSMHRFHLSFDLTTVKGFYLKNSGDFGRSIPDSAYFIFPDLRVGYFSTLLRYNVNPKFSTAALVGGTQAQTRTAWTVTPTFQFATFRFTDDPDTTRIQTEQTYSTDLNIIIPAMATWVLSPKMSLTIGAGPSFGVDFFKAVAVDADSKLVLNKGTKFTTGYTFQTAFSYNNKRFYTGIESRYRIYGHKFEDLERLDKQYSYFQVYFGWRMRAPGFAKKTLDWVNKVSPIDFD